MRLTLVRHTEVDVPSGICYGRTDVGLKSTFIKDALSIRQKLLSTTSQPIDSISHSEIYDGVYTSPISRCTLLAEACGYTDAIRDNTLMELDFGEWEMQRFDEITDPCIHEWFEDWYHVAPTGGESMHQQVDRVKKFLNLRLAEGKHNILIFTHAGVILSILLITGQATLSDLFDHQPPYGGILTIDYHPIGFTDSVK